MTADRVRNYEKVELNPCDRHMDGW